jgi:Serine/Threonine/Tyrosine Kinase found in polyvalent proteins
MPDQIPDGDLLIQNPDAMVDDWLKSQGVVQPQGQGATETAPPTTTATGAALRAAGEGVAPGAAAAAAFVPSAAIGSAIGGGPETPIGMATGLVGGIVGSAIAAGSAAWAQHKAAQLIAPEKTKQFDELSQADAEQHPIAGAVGRIASALPMFEWSPLESVRGVSAIYKAARYGVKALSKEEANAAKATAAQVGLGTGTAVVQPLLMGDSPTKQGIAEAFVQSLLLGEPNFKIFGKKAAASISAEEAANDVARENTVENPQNIYKHEQTLTPDERGQLAVLAAKAATGGKPTAEDEAAHGMLTSDNPDAQKYFDQMKQFWSHSITKEMVQAGALKHAEAGLGESVAAEGQTPIDNFIAGLTKHAETVSEPPKPASELPAPTPPPVPAPVPAASDLLPPVPPVENKVAIPPVQPEPSQPAASDRISQLESIIESGNGNAALRRELKLLKMKQAAVNHGGMEDYNATEIEPEHPVAEQLEEEAKKVETAPTEAQNVANEKTKAESKTDIQTGSQAKETKSSPTATPKSAVAESVSGAVSKAQDWQKHQGDPDKFAEQFRDVAGEVQSKRGQAKTAKLTGEKYIAEQIRKAANLREEGKVDEANEVLRSIKSAKGEDTAKTVEGLGQKLAAFFEDKNEHGVPLSELPAEEAKKIIYTDKTGGANSAAGGKKLVAMLSPDGTHVLVGSVHESSRGGKRVQKVSTGSYDTGNGGKLLRGEHFSPDYDKMVASGWKPLASLKSDKNLKNWASTYSPEEWQKIAGKLRGFKSDIGGKYAQWGMDYHNAIKDWDRTEDVNSMAPNEEKALTADEGVKVTTGDEGGGSSIDDELGETKTEDLPEHQGAQAEGAAGERSTADLEQHESFNHDHAEHLVEALRDVKVKAPSPQGLTMLAAALKKFGAVGEFKLLVKHIADTGSFSAQQAVELAHELIYENQQKNGGGSGKALAESAGLAEHGKSDAIARNDQATGRDLGLGNPDARSTATATGGEPGAGRTEEGANANGEGGARTATAAAEPAKPAAKSNASSLGSRLAKLIGGKNWDSVEEGIEHVKDAILDLPKEDQAKLDRLIGGDLDEHAEALAQVFESKNPAAAIDAYLRSLDKSATLLERNHERQNTVERLSQAAERDGGKSAEIAAASVLRRNEPASRPVGGEKQTPRERVAANRVIADREEAALSKHAEESGTLISNDDFEQRWRAGGSRSGAEHEVFPDQQNQRWVKRNPAQGQAENVGGMMATWSDYFSRLALHAKLFPDTAYRFLGFTKDANGKLHAVVDQPDVQAELDADGKAVGAGKDLVAPDMAKMGFVNTKGDNYYNKELGIYIEDLHDENAIVRKNGQIAYIDPIIYRAEPWMFEKGAPLFGQERPKQWLSNADVLDSRKATVTERNQTPQEEIRNLRPTDYKTREVANSIEQVMRAMGIRVDRVVDVLAKHFSSGQYKEILNGKGNVERIISWNVADQHDPSISNLVSLIHEVFHAMFARETPERQAAAHRAVKELSNEMLGIGDFKEYVAASVPQAERASVEQEGRLAQSLAVKLVNEGFNPNEAQGFAQQAWRLIKDIYHGTLMAIAKVAGYPVSQERAMKYFENRLKMTLAGDPISWVSYLGGPRMKMQNWDKIPEPRFLKPLFTGKTFSEIASALPEHEVAILPPVNNLKELAARAFASIFGKHITAADGTVVRIENESYPSITEFFKHLVSQNAIARINQEDRFDPDKARWITSIARTLKNAQVRLVDPENGNRIYVTRYAGGINHMIVVRADGSLENYKIGSVSHLVTQFPNSKPTRQGTYRVEWENGLGGSQTADPIQSGLSGAGPSQIGQGDNNTGGENVKYSGILPTTNPRKYLETREGAPVGIAALNGFVDAMREQIHKWDTEGNLAGLTDDQIRNQFIKLPAEVDGAEMFKGNTTPQSLIADAVKLHGVSPDTRIADMPNSVAKRMAAVLTHRLFSEWKATMEGKLQEARRDWKSDSFNLDRNNKQLTRLTKDYVDLDYMDATAKRAMLDLIDDINRSVKGIRDFAGREGALEQVAKQLEGAAELSDPAKKAINGLASFIRDDESENGVKFADTLQHIAGMDIDWKNAKTTDIAEGLRQSFLSTKDPRMEGLFRDTPRSKALLATVIAFGKSNSHMMDMLALRAEKDLGGRAEANKLLKDLMSASKGAIGELGERINKTFGYNMRLRDRMLRIADKIAALRDTNSDLLASINRNKSFVEFHDKAFSPSVETRMAEMERLSGISLTAFEVHHGAQVPVPNSEGVIEKKTLSLRTDIGKRGELPTPTSEQSAWMKRMQDYVDNHANRKDGAKYNEVHEALDKLKNHFVTNDYHNIKNGFVSKMLRPIQDICSASGTPMGRLLGQAFNRYSSLQRAKTREVVQTGTMFTAHLNEARKACGFPAASEQVFWNRVITPALHDLEQNGEKFWATAKTDDEMINGAISHAIQFMDDARPMTPKAKAAIEKLLRQHILNADMLVKNGFDLGNKVLDRYGNKDIYRPVLGKAPFTLPRALTDIAQEFYQQHMAGKWGGDDLKPQHVAAFYNQSPDLLRQSLTARFSPEVWRRFMKSLAYNDRPYFYAPAEGGIRPLASLQKIKDAYDTSHDPVTFAENLAKLHGAKPDAAFVADTIDTIQQFHNLLRTMVGDEAESVRGGSPAPKRFIVDARHIEAAPKEWMEYLMNDQYTMEKIIHGQAFQAAFGRNGAAMEKNFATAMAEQQQLAQKWSAWRDAIQAENPGIKEKELRAMLKQKAEQEGVTYNALKEASTNLSGLNSALQHFNALKSMNNSGKIPELMPWARLMRTIGGWTVSGMGTAITAHSVFLEQPTRLLGLNGRSLAMTARSVGDLAKVMANSMLQAVGREAMFDAQRLLDANQAGLFDPINTNRQRLVTAWNHANVAYHQAGVIGRNVGRVADLSGAALQSDVFAPGAREKALQRQAEGKAIAPTLKVASPFHFIAECLQISNFITWQRHIEGMVLAGVKHLQAHPELMDDHDFKFTRDNLSSFGAGEREFNFLTQRMADFGFSLEQLARDGVRNAEAGGKKPLLSDEVNKAIQQLTLNEITLESSLTSRMPQLQTSGLGVAMNPFLGWPLQKTYQVLRQLREPNGEATHKAFRNGLLAYAAILPIGMAVSWLRNKFDEDVLGRKMNISDLGNIHDVKSGLLTALDNASRIGTFGFIGEGANYFLNDDNVRPITLDNRIFFANTLQNLFNTSRSLYHQTVPQLFAGNYEGALNTATDYQTVVRPLFQALGGNGLLQNLGALNHILALDDAEARVSNRISVNNYLRVAGRELNMDVRTFGGMLQNQSTPNPIKPFVGQMVLAAYANDHEAFQAAMKKAVSEAKAEGMKPDEAMKKVVAEYEAQNPMKIVFKTLPTEAEYHKLIAQLPDNGKQSVQQAVKLFEHYGTQIGATASVLKKEKPDTSFALNPPRSRMTFGDMRSMATSYGNAL